MKRKLIYAFGIGAVLLLILLLLMVSINGCENTKATFNTFLIEDSVLKNLSNDKSYEAIKEVEKMQTEYNSCLKKCREEYENEHLAFNNDFCVGRCAESARESTSIPSLASSFFRGKVEVPLEEDGDPCAGKPPHLCFVLNPYFLEKPFLKLPPYARIEIIRKDNNELITFSDPSNEVNYKPINLLNKRENLAEFEFDKSLMQELKQKNYIPIKLNIIEKIGEKKTTYTVDAFLGYPPNLKNPAINN